MSPVFLSVAFVFALLQLSLPARYAFIPLLVTAFNIGNVEFLGELTLVRLLIILGITRAIATGTNPIDFRNPIDRLFLLFAGLAMLSAPFHTEAMYNPYNERIGLILNVLGTYFYGKAFLRGENVSQCLAIGSVIALLPLAILMTMEFTVGTNYYYPHFGAISSGVSFRDGFRARGPFGHAILAGTSGAVTLAFFFPFWKSNRRFFFLGAVGCLLIVIASNSSGPIAATIFTLGLVYLWRKRHLVRHAKLAVVFIILFLSLYMERPFYYIIDSIDFTGGSTGWHRARLIETSIEHLDEWWLFGTDYTRHWMPTGVSWNPDHSDITNYYLHIGVIGGLPLTLILITVIALCLKKLIEVVFILENIGEKSKAFATWCLIAALGAHATSFISISYFDQMFVLFYLLVATIANLKPPNKLEGETHR